MGDRSVRIIVRVLPTNQDVDVNVPTNATSIDIIESLLDSGFGPKTNEEGEFISYRLTSKGGMNTIGDNDILSEGRIRDGDLLIMAPVFGAGDTGKIFFSIPGNLKIGKMAIAKVSISRHLLSQEEKDKDFIPDEIEVELIEVSEVMQCTLEENAIRSHLEIKSINRKEQFFSKEGKIKWRFDLIPYSIGVTSLILRVSITKHIDKLGERHKDVFVFDKEVRITTNDQMVPISHRTTEKSFDSVEEISQWDQEKRKQILEHIRKGEIGQALSALANISQQIDMRIFNSIIVLQAKMNLVKNRFQLGVIDTKEWLMLYARISSATLELLDDLDQSKLTSADLIQARINNLDNVFESS